MLQTNRHERRHMASFEQAEEVLKRCFGHDAFRPEQERAIKAIMGKRDVLAVMSTGAGKSLIYQVPAVALGGTTIVVSHVTGAGCVSHFARHGSYAPGASMCFLRIFLRKFFLKSRLPPKNSTSVFV